MFLHPPYFARCFSFQNGPHLLLPDANLQNVSAAFVASCRPFRGWNHRNRGGNCAQSRIHNLLERCLPLSFFSKQSTNLPFGFKSCTAVMYHKSMNLAFCIVAFLLFQCRSAFSISDDSLFSTHEEIVNSKRNIRHLKAAQAESTIGRRSIHQALRCDHELHYVDGIYQALLV